MTTNQDSSMSENITRKRRMLVACEYSGTVRDAFTAAGWDAWSCDLLPTDKPGNHIQGDVLSILDDSWDLMIAHPPCTYLNRAGWHWVNKPDCATLPLKGEPRRRAAVEAVNFFMTLLSAPIPRIAVENPRPISHAKLPKESQVIHPWQHGHGETKATCLWLKNLPLLVPTNIVAGREQRIFKLPPSADRWKLRSTTFEGIARAMAEQWSNPGTIQSSLF